jgi:capsular exopolysaccharide synthesis family protein
MASQVESERARVVNRSLASFEAAKSREKMVLQSREKLRTQMGAASSHLMQHQLLKSEALANGELYNTLRGRLSEAGIYAGLRSSNIHIVDLAPKLITATGPHRLFIIVTGTFASCLFSVALAFVMEGFENKVRTAEDIRNWAGLPSLAMLPTIEVLGKRENRNSLKSFRTEVHTPAPSFFGNAPLAKSEAIRSLRTSLLLSGTASPPRVILISSAMMGEGKTTLSVNLATALAQGGRKCLLIDADLRRPRIAKIFGVTPDTGLADVLNESAEFEDALTPAPNVPGLSLITSGRTESDPTDLLRPERMRLILEKVKYKFDFVLIDSPPVIPFSDARLLALMAEVVILVGRYGFTTRRALGEGAKLFGDAQAPIWGVVLNDINAKSPDFQYNYGYVRGADEDSIRAIYCTPQESSSSNAQPAHGDEDDSKSRAAKSNKNDKAKGASA